MANRLIDVYLASEARDGVTRKITEHSDWSVLGVWSTELGNERSIVKILVDVEETEGITDYLSGLFAHDEDFRIIIMPVEASLPRPESPEDSDTDTKPKTHKSPAKTRPRVSREEIYAEMQDAVRLNAVFIVLVILSTIVAAIGLVRDNTAVIIGAMVIAPLLGPTIALALSSILSDGPLGRQALLASGVGIGLALLLSVVIGILFPVDPAGAEIAMRTQVDVVDIVLALAAGGAGALSLTAAVPSAVIGVMVAVALLPPLAVSGMLLGAGMWDAAYGALLLFAVNLICVHLAAVVTFLAQGIRPSKWWEAAQARRASVRALTISLIVLTVLAGLMYAGVFLQ